MPSYTLDELIHLMEPQHRQDQALIRKCIAGLTLYAAQHAQADPTSPKITELRDLIENLAYYWGLDDGAGSVLQKEFLDPFDERIAAAASGAEITDKEGKHRPFVIFGLYRYGNDMISSMGDMAKDEILAMSSLIKEVAVAWDFESDQLDKMVSDLETEAMLMEQPQAPEPDMQL